ncbi:LytR/AlgR family response regulator transcription factor [Roseivirga misakiensis]|uniref:DNA-binding response regulator n=1 Tax=Roseivirga misakiensis TaxID=1563681 RepID=A0A1E5SYC9_9BACT|nr:LytTR family DNA-binding domain-containing protein [Roseivirga misakiensis]OEK04047.1 DNA-binding response regulator [Roseivirga misakiensis]
MKKVIVVDDEDPARSLVKEYLEDYEDLVLLDECNNGVDAVKSINNFKPDLVFLDIQMPGLTGFEVLQKLDHMPQIIFATAYDEYAFQAFQVHALDYLLKPYTRERFAEAIQLVDQRSENYLTQIHSLVSSLNEQETYLTNLLVSVRQKLINIPAAEIIRIEANGDYAKLVTSTGSHLSNYGISALESKLNPQHFTRVHRSAIINVSYIKEVYKYPSVYEVVMTNDDVVKVSRSYLENIRKFIV